MSLLGYGIARYIEYQRDRWHGRGVLLSNALRAWLDGCFAGEDMARVRIVENARLPIPNPPGYGHLRRWTRLDLPDPESVAAITFDHVVLARRPVSSSLLFHEMVHVTQFRLLGVRRFSEQYARGFRETRSYEHIPLEACAFELENRFLCGDRPLNVEAEVRRRLNLP